MRVQKIGGRPVIDRADCMRSLAGFGFLAAVILWAPAALAQTHDAAILVLQGLSDRINIVIDRWGIPHTAILSPNVAARSSGWTGEQGGEA
jgi:hypothetical protein